MQVIYKHRSITNNHNSVITKFGYLVITAFRNQMRTVFF